MIEEQDHREAERAEVSALRAEVSALRAEMLALRAEITEQRRVEREARERADLFEAILEASPVLVYAKDLEGRYLFANHSCVEMLNIEGGPLQGRTDHEVFPKALADEYVASDEEAILRKRMVEREEHIQLRDGYHDFVTAKFPLLDPSGEVRAVCSSSTDITRLKRAEEENRHLQEEIIRAQEVTLRALSTPLLPIARGVVVMPLIGSLDRGRAERVLETLLDGIVAHQAGRVILDVTGVPDVDIDVAEALCRIAKAVKLLGATVLLTGIQPRIAQTLVQLGGDLGDIIPEGTLESGIARALRW